MWERESGRFVGRGEPLDNGAGNRDERHPARVSGLCAVVVAAVAVCQCACHCGLAFVRALVKGDVGANTRASIATHQPETEPHET